MHLLPNIATYIGWDQVVMLLPTGVAHSRGMVLALHTGTNTEVCQADHGTVTVVSCASGAAFEDAHIRHGIRAAAGAIERLHLAVDSIEYLPLDRFRHVGNAANMGAILALISRTKRAEAQALSRQVGYIELAFAPHFARTLAQAMYLG
jgi:uncharacterized 2Fe-2S/4Fe-4S cluster protein (DUF4445 family)